jgi:hypothetical protein
MVWECVKNYITKVDLPDSPNLQEPKASLPWALELLHNER